MDNVLRAIRRAPLRTHADCVALLGCVVSRLADFDRDTPDLDLSVVIDRLADAEAELENVYAIDPEVMREHYRERAA